MRKITIAKSVRYVSDWKSEYSPKDHKPNTASLLKKQNQKLSECYKKFIKNRTREGFGIIKLTMICYCYLKNHTKELIEQTKRKALEKLTFRLNKPNETFSFNPLINLSEKE